MENVLERAERIRKYVEAIVETIGEHPECELKQEWKRDTDKKKAEFIKDIQSIANSEIAQGKEKYLVVGAVEETKSIVGCDHKEFDDAGVRELLEQYLDPVPEFEVLTLTSSKGFLFVVFRFPHQPNRPFVAIKEIIDKQSKQVHLRVGEIWLKPGASDTSGSRKRRLISQADLVQLFNNGSSSQPTVEEQQKLLQSYCEKFAEKYSKVRLLGEESSRELKDVFVELNIIEEYQRPSTRNEWMGFVDLEMRKRRTLFQAFYDDEREKEKRMVRPETLLQDGTRAVITGAPGCGKSTLLRWLAVRTLNNSSPLLPVFLELKSLTREIFQKYGASLTELLYEHAIAPLLLSPERERIKDDFSSMLAANRVAIFLDGLDEVHNAEFFTPLCESINQFINSAYGRNLLIISTRPYALDVRFADAKEMEIAPLNQQRVAAFLKHYYGNDSRLDLDKLIPKLQRRELSEVIRVPLLLGALVRRYRESGKLVGNRLKLYDGLVRDLAVTVDSEKNVKRFMFSDREGRRNLAFLRRIAFKKLFEERVENDGERLTFTEDWILDQAEAFCGQLATKIDHFDFAADIQATPLLREVADNVWAFSHLTIQEFLAASVLSKHQDCERIFCRAYFDQTLVETMEALPMTLAMVEKPDNLYQSIERLPDSLSFIGLRLRSRGLAYGAEISHELLQQLANRLVEFISGTKAEESGYCWQIVSSFRGISGQHLTIVGESIDKLIKLAAVSNIRENAIVALGKIGGGNSCRYYKKGCKIRAI